MRRSAMVFVALMVGLLALGGLPGSARAATFSNSAPMTIPTFGPASVYPSNITVSGLPSTISKVSVTLNGLSHTFVWDLDLLLVSPAGTKFILLSGVCNNRPMVNATVTLDDAAASTIAPAGGVCPSGTFRPTSTFPSHNIGAPAPTGPYQIPAPAGAATLAVFNGENPNGTWSLYVFDDENQDSGSLSGGWSLAIITDQTPPELNISIDPTTKDARVEGVDNPGGSGLATANPIAPTTCATLRAGVQQCVYRATDNEGNSVTATLQITKQSGQTQIVVQRIQYSGKPAVTPLTNSLVASFAPPTGAPTQFSQTASVIESGPPSISRKVTANWTSAAGNTTVTPVTPPGPVQTCPSLTPLRVRTQAGALSIPPVC